MDVVAVSGSVLIFLLKAEVFQLENITAVLRILNCGLWMRAFSVMDLSNFKKTVTKNSPNSPPPVCNLVPSELAHDRKLYSKVSLTYRSSLTVSNHSSASFSPTPAS